MPRFFALPLAISLVAIIALAGALVAYDFHKSGTSSEPTVEPTLYLEWDHQQTTSGKIGADVLLAADLHYTYTNKWQAQNERGERLNAGLDLAGYTQSFDSDPRMFFVRVNDRDQLEVWKLRTPSGVTGEEHARAVKQQASALGLSVKYKLLNN